MGVETVVRVDCSGFGVSSLANRMRIGRASSPKGLLKKPQWVVRKTLEAAEPAA